MRTLYLVNISIHVLAAMFWLGGMFFLGLVGAPVLRTIEPPSLRQKLFNDLGVRFRTAGWIAIAVLVMTGIGNLYFRGWLSWNEFLGASEFWGSRPGRMLAVKLVGVTVMLAASAVHDFALGPAASREVPGSPQALALRRRSALLARVNALVGIGVVLAAVLLARGW
ncbi:MAG TPA: CopD family protein [Gemmatimonadaceae bacterium]